METSMLLAKYMGLVYLAVGFGFIVSRKYYEKFLKDAMKELSMTYIGGLLAFVFGLTVMMYHNVWVGSWEVIITILGWAALLKGISLLTFPTQMMGMYDKIMKMKGLLNYAGIAAIVLGAILTYYGFMA